MIDQEVKNWVIKAYNDYKTMIMLFSNSEEELITDTLCFHAQQFAEKSIKAFLIKHNVDFKKNHDLIYLLNLCVEIDSDFVLINDSMEALSPYAVTIRYPDDFYIPTPEEAHAAINHAKIVKEFVLAKLNIDKNTIDFPS